MMTKRQQFHYSKNKFMPLSQQSQKLKNIKIPTLFFCLALLLLTTILEYFPQFQEEINEIELPDGLINITIQTRNYLKIQEIKDHSQLPICALVHSQIFKSNHQSLFSQIYKNYHVVVLGEDEGIQDTYKKINITSVEWNNQKANYFALKQIIEKNCEDKELVYIMKTNLKDKDALYKLNLKFQTKKGWVWFNYDPAQNILILEAFYKEIFFKLSENDFKKQYQGALKENNFQGIVWGIFSLTKNRQIVIQDHWLYKKITNKRVYCINSTTVNIRYLSQKFQYQRLLYMSQSKQLPQDAYLNRLSLYAQKKEVRKFNLLEFYDFKNLVDLPENHSLRKRYQSYMQDKYQLMQYQDELPMCVVIPSHNNIPNKRYKRIMETVLYQNYKNYHVVFIDDFSSDQTLNMTKKFVKEYGFPDDRIKFIRNEKQMFATYNIYNAANNECGRREILVLLDGDDEVVGTEVFRMINSFYKKSQNWIVYTNYYSSLQTIGWSRQVRSQNFEDPTLYRKVPNHYFGMIRTFITQLFLKIKIEDHKDKNGDFFDIVYDDAMQYPLFEMAGTHIQYVREICYFYNKEVNNFGKNQEQKQERISQVFSQLLTRQNYGPLKQLFEDVALY